MKRRVFLSILLAFLIAFPVVVHAQQGQVFDVEGDAQAYEKLSTITSSTGFTAAKIQTAGGAQARAALISVETAAVRFTLDGTTPVVTATSNGTGHLLNAGDSYVIRGANNIKRFRAINAVDGNGALIFCTFFY